MNSGIGTCNGDQQLDYTTHHSIVTLNYIHFIGKLPKWLGTTTDIALPNPNFVDPAKNFVYLYLSLFKDIIDLKTGAIKRPSKQLIKSYQLGFLSSWEKKYGLQISITHLLNITPFYFIVTYSTLIQTCSPPTLIRYDAYLLKVMHKKAPVSNSIKRYLLGLF